MNDMATQGGRKTKTYGRSARPSLRELIKDFQQLEPFAEDIARVEHPEKARILFGSYTRGNNYAVISIFPEDQFDQYFIGVKNDKKTILKIWPEKKKAIFCTVRIRIR
jgi:hypothetical protein